ncbi:MAG: hypothetical protein EZS28_001740 [Streblomastix strix]|uniref:Uncharacterized protein n=1 Tax=Streblomastix strix TaxID=222440 RepID=A0A5J4X681_9EUKA|nr:MAG: hypothetical protein EZS28_001740 [Streblomastix strix]
MLKSKLGLQNVKPGYEFSFDAQLELLQEKLAHLDLNITLKRYSLNEFYLASIGISTLHPIQKSLFVNQPGCSVTDVTVGLSKFCTNIQNNLIFTFSICTEIVEEFQSSLKQRCSQLLIMAYEKMYGVACEYDEFVPDLKKRILSPQEIANLFETISS